MSRRRKAGASALPYALLFAVSELSFSFCHNAVNRSIVQIEPDRISHQLSCPRLELDPHCKHNEVPKDFQEFELCDLKKQ